MSPRSCAIAALLCLVAFLTLPSNIRSAEPKRVLILLQEDVSWPVFRLIHENLSATLQEGLPNGVQIFTEHLDRTHFPDSAVQADHLSLIRKKYADLKLDLVVAVGDVPTDLFPSVPVVFVSADLSRRSPGLQANSNIAASVWVDLDARKTLELARRLQPSARQIIVIGNESTSEDNLLGRLRNELSANATDLQATYLTNGNVPTVCQRVSEISPDTIVLFVSVTQDEHGHPLISAEVVQKVAAASRAPVYVLFDTHVGTGALGGFVASFVEVGIGAGHQALSVLAGEHPRDILAQNLYLFDWRQLRRWKIPESSLPLGSVVLNREPGIWESYRWYIVGGILLCIAQTLLILGLLRQRARRRRVESSLVTSLAFERLLSDLSTTFVTLPEDQITATIDYSLGRIGEFLDVERINVLEFSRESSRWLSTNVWCKQGVPTAPAEASLGDLPWWSHWALRGEALFASDLTILPEEAALEAEFLRRIEAVSVATVPLKAGDDLFGSIVFISTTRQVEWTGEIQKQLTLLGEIFSNTLERKRARDAGSRHAAVVESSDDAIMSKNLDGIITSWNAGAERIFGFSESEALGRPITILIPPDLIEEESLLMIRLNAGDRIEHFETERLTKSGSLVDVSLTISPVKDAAGRIVAFSETARDITERKRAQQVLRESEERFRLIANNAPVMIWMSSTDKLCDFFNYGWLDFTGRSLEQELGEGWVSGVHPDDLKRCLDVYSSSFDARSDFEMEYRLRRFDGEYRWIVDFGVPRFDTGGRFCGYIGSCVDITDRKASEESLHELSGRLIGAQEQERSRIARELHDDFSQRLALLSINLGQLWKKLPESDVEERARVMEILNRTKEISTDIHSLSHQLHSSKLEHVGLVPALNGLCSEISEKYDVRVQLRDAGTPPVIPKDVALCLFRVAQEALANVVKHSEASNVRLVLDSNSNGITLRITDDGKGFDLASANPKAGIGLVGMRERLRLVKGKLQVRSEPTKGTEIVAEIPMFVPVHIELRSRAEGA